MQQATLLKQNSRLLQQKCMEKFDIHILGCGSALPTTRHLPSTQVVNVRDKLFMIDCAEGCQLQLRRTGLKFSRMNHIFISHLHGDHCFGLIGLISTFDLLGRTSQLHIYSPGETLERLLRPWLDFFCRDMGYEVVFHAFSPNHTEIIYEDRSLTVSTIPLKHRVPCCGFFFREKAPLPHIRRDMVDFLHIPFFAINAIKEGGNWEDADGKVWTHEQLTVAPAAQARSYAYCSDTMPVAKNTELVRGADLLYHEATFGADAAPRARETGHSTAAQAAQFAAQAEVGRLVIGHFSARYDDEKELLKEAKAAFADTHLAYEGMKIEL